MRRIPALLTAALLLLGTASAEELTMNEIPVTSIGPVRIGQAENTEAVSEAIKQAVENAESACGYPAARDLPQE
jgi:cell division ATPase FtsA